MSLTKDTLREKDGGKVKVKIIFTGSSWSQADREAAWDDITDLLTRGWDLESSVGDGQGHIEYIFIKRA